MGNLVTAGTDAATGTYACTNCGHELLVYSTKSIGPCPHCGNDRYDIVTLNTEAETLE